jgi:hypothetical protein
MIQLPRLENWMVYLQPQFLEEMYRAPDEHLSFVDATSDGRYKLTFVYDTFSDTLHTDFPSEVRLRTKDAGNRGSPGSDWNYRKYHLHAGRN